MREPGGPRNPRGHEVEPFSKEPLMNKDQVKGVGEQVKGKANEVAGKVTGNKAQELKGDVQQGAGKVQKAYGDGKEQARKDRDHH
jgi:uncharacterized protein YjbJ (UPF0337 family)